MSRDDKQLFSQIEKTLYTPVVGDILDQMGRFHQFLPAPIRPLREEMKVIGRAMPVLMMDVFGPQERPFGLMPEALDDLRPGEVYIGSGAAPRSANFGELMTAAAKARGAAGAVVDGYHRDTPQVLEQGFSLFSRGPYAQDSGPRMKVADFRVRIEIGGVTVEPGDLVFGDVDGVLIIPRSLETEVLRAAFEKAKAEKTVRREIEDGAFVRATFDKYGVL